MKCSQIIYAACVKVGGKDPLCWALHKVVENKRKTMWGMAEPRWEQLFLQESLGKGGQNAAWQPALRDPSGGTFSMNQTQ